MKQITLILLLILLSGCNFLSDSAKYFEDTKVQEIAKAIADDNIEKIHRLKSEGVDLNTVGAHDMTLIEYAYKKKSFSAFKELVNMGINIYYTTNDDRSILVDMVRDKDSRYFEFLLDHGLDPNFSGRGNRLSLLHQAILFSENSELIKKLLNKGANPHWNDDQIFSGLAASSKFKMLLTFLENIDSLDTNSFRVKYGIKVFQKSQVINEDEKQIREKIRQILISKNVKVDFEYSEIVSKRNPSLMFD